MWSNHGTMEWGFRYHNDSDDGSAAATLNLTWASQLSFVSFTYQQGPGTTTGTPHIGVKSTAFTPVTC